MKVVRDRTSRQVLPSSSTRSGAVLLGCSVARGRQTAVPDDLILPHVWGVVHRRTAGQDHVTTAADLVCPGETGRAAGIQRWVRTPRALSLAATTTGLALLLAACSGGEGVDAEGLEEAPDPTASADDGAGAPAGEGMLVAALANTPDQFDPHATTSQASFQVLENVEDTLVVPSAENLTFEPSLAEEWETSEDRLTWTFTLREASGVEHVRTARSKGLTAPTVLGWHVLRNALLPFVTVVGVQLAYLLFGVVVVEIVFSHPGLGELALQAVQSRDFPLLQGAVLLFAVVFLVINLLVDLSYAVLDPRVGTR